MQLRIIKFEIPISYLTRCESNKLALFRLDGWDGSTMITILNVMQPELSNWNQGSQKSWEISLLSEKELLYDQSS